MSHIDIIRAWTDPEYRDALTEEQCAQLPGNPAGMVAIDDAELARISGGRPFPQTTAPTCTQYTWLDWKACCS
ncbi:MAG: mersacidin/lichenicidin family type 2 lantibiotic [Acidobacteriota bacterium]|nr:mersacidin/lichenicidin family type 2 lantibiotic [Acidobacteriota bacterium]